MPLDFAVTLVVPILNEAHSLPELLDAIQAQSLRPRELIFSDAGSTDGSRELILAWWQEHAWPQGSCQVLLLPGAMPGGGRNLGIASASNEWIAFLDGGVTPQTDWLENLCRYAQEHQCSAVFGLCHFSAPTAFSKAVCALSYGHGAVHPVIPASLFRRSEFQTLGFFPEQLRAGEDLVWVQRLIAHHGPRQVCSSARVSYTHFPAHWAQAIHKWYVTEYHCVLAGVRRGQQLAYLVAFLLICPALFFSGWWGVGGFFFYLVLRGVLDPMRRSADKPWWGNQVLACLIAPVLVTTLDLAKLAGIVRGLIFKMRHQA